MTLPPAQRVKVSPSAHLGGGPEKAVERPAEAGSTSSLWHLLKHSQHFSCVTRPLLTLEQGRHQREEWSQLLLPASVTQSPSRPEDRHPPLHILPGPNPYPTPTTPPPPPSLYPYPMPIIPPLPASPHPFPTPTTPPPSLSGSAHTCLLI